jgi:hypothetical protein
MLDIGAELVQTHTGLADWPSVRPVLHTLEVDPRIGPAPTRRRGRADAPRPLTRVRPLHGARTQARTARAHASACAQARAHTHVHAYPRLDTGVSEHCSSLRTQPEWAGGAGGAADRLHTCHSERRATVRRATCTSDATRTNVRVSRRHVALHVQPAACPVHPATCRAPPGAAQEARRALPRAQVLVCNEEVELSATEAEMLTAMLCRLLEVPLAGC